MLRKSLLIFSIFCAAILIGCSKTEMSNSNSGSTTASSGDKVGIPECDDYLTKYESCTPKVPEPGRAAYKSAGEQLRASWKKMVISATFPLRKSWRPLRFRFPCFRNSPMQT